MLFTTLLILGLCLAGRVRAESNIIFKLKRMECLVNPEFVAKPICVVKALNWNKGVAQMDCDLLKPIRNMTAHIRIFKRDYSNQFQPFLVDVVVNMCDVMSKRNYQVYGTITRKIASTYSNFNHSCPYEGHMIARNLYVDEKFFPAFPLGLYKISLYLMENRAGVIEYIGEIQIFVDVMEVVHRRNSKKKGNKERQ